MSRGRALALALLVPLGSSAQVRIEGFQPAGGALLPGGVAVSSLRIANNGGAGARLWVGYSVQDPAGRWHDVPARPVRLGAGERSAPVRLGWRVPATPAPGPYRVAMAVWSAPPGSANAHRLASAGRAGAFRVFRRHEAGAALRPPAWSAGEHALGRGRVRARNTVYGRDGVHLRLPARSCDGAEIRGAERVGVGSYAARMKAADAPGSITAFFLYEDVPGGNDEIDVEIVGRRLLVGTWVAGRQTNRDSLDLPFDPAAGFHEYGIDYQPGAVAVTVDGREVRRWTERLPRRPMRLMANAWRPVWLPCARGSATRAAVVEWIRR